ncbi:hypothetical protein LguiB_008993 [Lonicera macranthoides]
MALAVTLPESYICAYGDIGVLIEFLMLSGQHMGSEATLPYLSPELTRRKLLVGANFASAGIGILNDTGIQFVSASPSHTYIDQNS